MLFIAKEMDLSNTIKNGIMFIEDNSRWQPHFFVLTKRKLLYTEMTTQDNASSDQSNVTNPDDDNVRVFKGCSINIHVFSLYVWSVAVTRLYQD